MFYEDLMIDYHAMECQPITLSSDKSFRLDRILDYLDACFWASMQFRCLGLVAQTWLECVTLLDRGYVLNPFDLFLI